jgi:hypothetical protein
MEGEYAVRQRRQRLKTGLAVNECNRDVTLTDPPMAQDSASNQCSRSPPTALPDNCVLEPTFPVTALSGLADYFRFADKGGIPKMARRTTDTTGRLRSNYV